MRWGRTWGLETQRKQPSSHGCLQNGGTNASLLSFQDGGVTWKPHALLRMVDRHKETGTKTANIVTLPILKLWFSQLGTKTGCLIYSATSFSSTLLAPAAAAAATASDAVAAEGRKEAAVSMSILNPGRSRGRFVSYQMVNGHERNEQSRREAASLTEARVNTRTLIHNTACTLSSVCMKCKFIRWCSGSKSLAQSFPLW